MRKSNSILKMDFFGFYIIFEYKKSFESRRFIRFENIQNFNFLS